MPSPPKKDSYYKLNASVLINLPTAINILSSADEAEQRGLNSSRWTVGGLRKTGMWRMVGTPNKGKLRPIETGLQVFREENMFGSKLDEL